MSRLIHAHWIFWYGVLLGPFIASSLIFYWLASLDASITNSFAHTTWMSIISALQTIFFALFILSLSIGLYIRIPRTEDIKIQPILWLIAVYVVLGLYKHAAIPVALLTQDVIWYHLGVISSAISAILYLAMTYKAALLLSGCEARTLKPPLKALLLTWFGFILWVVFLPILKRRTCQQLNELNFNEEATL